MSWFDTSGIANLAKSALKEAQKTIDKALDIKDEEQQSNNGSKISSPISPQEDTDNFFASWGLKLTEEKEMGSESVATISPTVDHRDLPRSSNKLTMSTSLWGSFTGSFFENPRSPGEGTGGGDEGAEDPVSMQPKKQTLFRTGSLTQEPKKDRELFKSLESEDGTLCDDSSELGVEEGFSRSKLVVESEDGDASVRSRLSSCEDEEVEVPGQSAKDTSDGSSLPAEVTRRGETNSCKNNRLSVISSESDKKSSESVEILGSSEGGSGFTTSPDSDMPLLSPEISTSSSVMELKLSTMASSPESVEIIPDTPSSVEVLGEDSSGRTSRATMFSSPFMSPIEPPDHPTTLALLSQAMTSGSSRFQEEKSRGEESSEKISPESVEVIPEEEEDEEDMSVADDSYTSASESTATATTTIVEQPGLGLGIGTRSDGSDLAKSPLHLSKLHCAGDSSSNESSLYSSTVAETTDLKSPPVEGIKTNLQLVLSGSELQIEELRDERGGPKSRLSSKVLGNVACESVSDESSLLSDSRTLVNTDSSCEGTIMESSSEETIVTAGADDSAKSSPQQTSSYYVKTLLADAMGEEEVRESKIEQMLPTRDQSPISSESRSDMVKVESEQTSGHTSGDELETTTSSDIEIISSPNGDSSSTQSRQSPAKLPQRTVRVKPGLIAERPDSPSLEMLTKDSIGKTKGHQRELSETSSGGSEEGPYPEVEKLLKRIAEMTEILEARESKLIEMSRCNVELQESNSDLKSQLDAALHSKVAESQDIHQVAEEYTQRLSSLECKFQQAIRDKENLRKQLEQAKLEAASRLSAGELESLVAEKDEIIQELREEGEKLSKQQLQHSNIIKKLRAKEKESENTIKNQKDQLEELSQEVERMKRSLTAKEEVERTQIEAVHQLTAKCKRQEKELAGLRSQLEEANQNVGSLKNTVELLRRELSENKKLLVTKEKELNEARLSAELAVRQEMMAALDESRQAEQEEREALLAQVDELHLRLRQAEETYLGRETAMRQESNDLLRRLEQAEARNEELAQSVSVSTRPLLRQIESLQAANSAQQLAWEKQERTLSETVGELQGRVTSLIEQERVSREENVTLRSRVSSLESRLAASSQEAMQLRAKLEQQEAQFSQLKHDRDREHSSAESLRAAMTEEMAQLRRDIVGLEQQLAVERTANEAEKRRCCSLQEQLREREMVERERNAVRSSSPLGTPRSSPTLSFGRASFSESLSGSAWPQFQDDAFECGSSSGRYSNVYDSVRPGNTTSLLEGLQAQLKLRDGNNHITCIDERSVTTNCSKIKPYLAVYINLT
ncbi:TATA element modulatory factor isoform X2 [Anabrus simplex]|uniref:TATA element modulatory factor isoform X2 n=1 Tax=Anabrus simplex TaxID=316456 RepID=UPI0035A29383